MLDRETTHSPILNRVIAVAARYRRVVVIVAQAGLIVTAYVGSFFLRLDLSVADIPWSLVLDTLPLLLAVRVVALLVFRLDRGMWRYVGVVDLIQIVYAATLGTLVFAALEIPIFGLQEFPRSVFLLDWAANIFLLAGVRLGIRVLRQRFRPMAGVGELGTTRRLVIIGAGDAGAALCSQALSSPAVPYQPVAFLDDDPRKAGTSILGVPVVGKVADLASVTSDYRAGSVVVAVPSATPASMRRLVDICRSVDVPFKVLPATSDLLDEKVSFSRIREVDPADLLGRPRARLDRESIRRSIQGKRVMITGAAGSVGSELARQIPLMEPGSLLLVDRAENPLLFLESELRSIFPALDLEVTVAEVTDRDLMLGMMRAHVPDLVFHAAAYKHVPFMENSPSEAVRNNVGGTDAMARSCCEAGVGKFVMVSTDKAVNPSSVMGASKRLAELLVRSYDSRGSTRFVSVRFGNVLGSNASVVPIFRQQIAAGGPVTVTHPEVDRYFMSVSEAAGLILQAAAAGTGGETFELDMGDPVRIVKLAETLIELSGLKPHRDIEIVFTGLRPGEKLSEELTTATERTETTDFDKLLLLRDDGPTRDVRSDVAEFLGGLSCRGPDDVKARLKELVPEYQYLVTTSGNVAAEGPTHAVDGTRVTS